MGILSGNYWWKFPGNEFSNELTKFWYYGCNLKFHRIWKNMIQNPTRFILIKLRVTVVLRLVPAKSTKNIYRLSTRSMQVKTDFATLFVIKYTAVRHKNDKKCKYLWYGVITKKLIFWVILRHIVNSTFSVLRHWF